jgi:tellurite resistance protein TehA-like permease
MIELILLFLLAGFAGALVLRRRFEKGTVQRTVATVSAVVLGLIGLTGVAFFVLIMVSMASWANNK